MADPLSWKPNQGYDIHVLRGGPTSKSLVGSVNLPAGNLPSTLTFSPQIDGNLNKFGLSVNQSTGEVTASVPPQNTSQAVINNFLMTVSVQDSSAKTYETEIRIHIHDSVTDIWLTPSTLTIRKGANECRFTVLASFNDGVVGDITDGGQLSWKSLDPSTQADSTDILVAPDGALQAVNPGKTARIIGTLQLPALSLPHTLSAAAMAIATPSWDDLSAKANVNFVVAGLRLKAEEKDKPQKSGTVVPNKDDPNSAKRDSVESVVKNALNVLFVSEGFSRESDFNNLVNKIVEDLRTQDYLVPFKLLQDSINYWSVFVPSQENGITLLGEFVVNAVPKPPSSFLGNFLHQPSKPSASAATWSLEEMIHEVGLPASNDPTTLDSIKELWKLRYGVKDYQTLAAKTFATWRRMASVPSSWRSLLNEHDTAFGMRNCDRSRAAPTFSEVMLGSDQSRRTTDVNIFKFIAGLHYGKHPVTGATYNLGSAWNDGSKDSGLLCFLCLTQKHAGNRWGGYFMSSTGRSASINLKVTKTAKGASTVDIDNPALSAWDQTLLATVVAHEFGHALGLADEYGDGRGLLLQLDHNQEPNLLDKRIITTTTPGAPPMRDKTVYDKTQEIKWLWPRITRAGVLNGTPQKSGTGLRVPLQKGHGKPFVFQDVVRFRETPVRVRPSQDPFMAYPPLSFIITAHDDDGVNVVLGHPGGAVVAIDLPIPGSSDQRPWGDVFLPMFKPGVRYALICPLRRPGVGGGSELKLVADKILNQIALSNAPLNAPPGNEMAGQETAACVAAGGVGSDNMTPTNLPAGFPPVPFSIAALSDIVGIYEGGGHHDCGVFRPAGRCKMRGQFEQGIPFCHVCRYLIVDKVDPTKHGELDDIYEPYYPK